MVLRTLSGYDLIFDHDESSYQMPTPTPEQLEEAACNPSLVRIEDFNPHASIPHGVTTAHICGAMCRIPDDCIDSKRYPLFIARSVLKELIESLQSPLGVKPC